MINFTTVANFLFLIYGPRLFGSSFLDFTLLPFLWLSIIYLRSRSSLILPRSFFVVFYSLIILLCSSITISLFKATYDYIHIFKLMRILVSGFVIIIFIRILFERGVTKEQLINLFCFTVSVHAFIVIVQFFSSDFSSFLKIINGYQGAASRPTGLTWSLNASAIPSAFAVFLILNNKNKNYLQLFLIIFSMSLMGRTSFILMLGILLIRFFMSFGLKRLVQISFISIFLMFSLNPLINYLLNLEDLNVQLYIYLQLLQILLGEISLDDAEYVSVLFETLQSFLIVPNVGFDILFGTGLSGRESVYVASDMGVILTIFSFGLFGLLIFTFLNLYLVFLARNSSIFEPILMITVLMFLLNFKENIFFARHVSAVFFFCLVYLSLPRMDDAKKYEKV